MAKQHKKRTLKWTPVPRQSTAKKLSQKRDSSPNTSSYEAKDITVLEGLEPVRKRPGMFIGSTGSTGLHHLLWEVVDNSIDEAMAGHCTKIVVTLCNDGTIRVEDNGRGIPVTKHKQTKKSALETVLTMLHAGGKFGGSGYKVSGGLHGVGVSVVNALSEWTRAEVKRDGYVFSQEYSCGKPKTKHIKKEKPTNETGTTIMFRPDKTIFSTLSFNIRTIINTLRERAYLTKKVKIIIHDERDDRERLKPYQKAIHADSEKEDSTNGSKTLIVPRSYTFYFEGGVESFIRALTRGKETVSEKPFYAEKEIDDVVVEIAFQYTSDIKNHELSFANTINTNEGGTHLAGFRKALTRLLNKYGRDNSYIKAKEENLTGDDTREGLISIISVRVPEPQFEGQTKAKLGNPEVGTIVESVVHESLGYYLEEHPAQSRQILGRCLLAAKARLAARAAKESVIRKGALDGFTLPGKLADCSSRDPENCEMYIVEGDSAGGSAKQGRNRSFQAILPLRGKILNVEKARLDKMLASKEIKALILALGAGIGDQFDISKLRYHRIIIMTDADVDGAHIRTLLLTFFYRYFPELIEKGHLYIAQPPLFRVQGHGEDKYVYNEKEKIILIDQIEKASSKTGNKQHGSALRIQRYKGLGEMNPNQLWDTTMDPEQRNMMQVTIEDAEKADEIFDILMGDIVSPRRKFIQTHAKKVKNLDV